jgi:Spy/CpxP family protein refolding chaperone
MKRLNVIIPIAIVMALITGIVFAAEEAEKADKGKPEQAQLGRMRGRAAMGMGQSPMMGRFRGMGDMTGGGRGESGVPTDRATAILRLANQLKLSETQRRDLNELITSHRKAMIAQRAERDIAKVDLQKLMRKQEPDVEEVREQLMNIAKMEVEMKCARIEVGIEAKNILTAEQQAALKKMLSNPPPAQRFRGGRGAGRTAPNREEPREQ